MAVWEAALRTTVFEGRAIQAAWRPSRGGWRQAITLAHGGEGLGDPQVTIDAHGRAVALWETAYPTVPSPPVPALQSAFGDATSARWGAVQALTSPGEAANHAELGSAATGGIVAVWERDGRTSNAVVALRGSTAAGSWGAPTTVASWGHIAPILRMCRDLCPRVRQLPPAAPQVTMNARGDAALVWEQAGAYRPFVRLARLPVAARTWSAPVRVSAPGAAEARVALDGFDDAFVIWEALGACRGPCLQAEGSALSAVELPSPSKRARR